VGGAISRFSHTLSNSSVAGIASSSSVPSLNIFPAGTFRALQEASRNLTSMDDYLAKWELSTSKSFAHRLLVHTVPGPTGLVHNRTTSIITKMPALALWLLVAANLLLAPFGLVVAILAVRATSPEVHQIHTRLITTGLAAQLCDWQHARKPADNESGLFKEIVQKDSKAVIRKWVSIRCTAPGGAEFMTEDVLETTLEEGEQVRPLQSRQTL
jgi:hypothetical protein